MEYKSCTCEYVFILFGVNVDIKWVVQIPSLVTSVINWKSLPNGYLDSDLFDIRLLLLTMINNKQY